MLKLNKQKPYKFRKVHALLDRDKPVRVAYCNWVLEKVVHNPLFSSDIMWTDESTFTRNGIWNRQNLRYWSRQNPYQFHESSHQYRFSLNVWAGIYGNQIIGPIFIDGNLNAAKFLELLEGPVSEYIEELPIAQSRRLWYQLDGAPAHSVVGARFGEQWIGRYGPARWPPRSPDLTPPDFFLWGAVYATDVISVEDLRAQICTAFDRLKTLAAN